METITLFIKTGITWGLTLFIIGALVRPARESRNPLDWSIVDRCLFLMVIIFFFGGFVHLFSTRLDALLGRLPYINWDFMPLFARITTAIGIGWVFLLLIALWLRKRSPDNTFLAHLVVQTMAFQTALYGYFFGPITDPVPILYGLALGAFNLLLFKPSVALPSVGTYVFLTLGFMFASWFGIIPYAPLIAKPPFDQGKLLSFHWGFTLAFAMLIFVLMLLLIAFIVVRWRNREDRLAEMTELLKKMFGRYLSTEVMNSLIENPSALELGGERRRVTIMMTDLRGFTALSERLEPEQVVQMLNVYFEVMVELVLKYNGTINEIIGDALLIIFGAPQEMPDRTRKAIACSIEMQNAMAEVNEENRAQGLPELEMGIGLNETEVIVGNVGSSKRSKYAVVGSGVNMTSRIESYTVGGQILISESVRREAGEILRINAQRDVLPKGAETPLRIYEVGGIAGQYNLALEEKEPSFVTLERQVPIRCAVLDGKEVGKKGLGGVIVRLSKKSAEITIDEPVDLMTNLKMNLGGLEDELAVKDFYGKVIESSGERQLTHLIRFTAVPPEMDYYFQALRRYDARPSAI